MNHALHGSRMANPFEWFRRLRLAFACLEAENEESELNSVIEGLEKERFLLHITSLYENQFDKELFMKQ